MSVLGVNHARHVRTLYKAILRLHRSMPAELQNFGNEYVRDEFRRHKGASQEFAAGFLQEWAKYYVTLSRQLFPKQHVEKKTLGENLKLEQLDFLREDQVGQLYELFLETRRLNELNSKS